MKAKVKKTIPILILLALCIPHSIKAATNPPWQTFSKDGVSCEDIYIFGRGRTAADLLVEITKTGGDKKGEYRYSSDGGYTWSDEKVIKTGSDIPLYSTGKNATELGLKMRFGAVTEYVTGDLYHLYEPISYEVIEGANIGVGQIQISSEDVIYNDSYDIVVKITKSGTYGEGEFSYSINGGRTYSEPFIIPPGGVVKLFNNPITFRFWAKDGNFFVGDEYRCIIKGDQSKRDYTPYALTVAAMLLLGLFMICYRFLMMRDKPQKYRLFEYKPVEGQRKHGLPRRREM